jgi:hypothetical protein
VPVTPASIRDRKPPPGAPPEGKFRVTIRIERPDGQFVTSETTVPSDLMSRPDPDRAQEQATAKIAGGFVATYRRAAELPK